MDVQHSEEFRVLVTGSRGWTDESAIQTAFDMVESHNRDQRGVVVLVHGTAAGADTLAEHEAVRRGWTIEAHPAHWETHTDQCPSWHWALPKCKMAGHRRNAEMVSSGADVCFAFIKDKSPGASACLALAEKANIPAHVWRE